MANISFYKKYIAMQIHIIQLDDTAYKYKK